MPAPDEKQIHDVLSGGGDVLLVGQLVVAGAARDGRSGQRQLLALLGIGTGLQRRRLGERRGRRPQVNALVSAAAVGMHILADLHGVDPKMLRDAPALERLLREAARTAGAHVLGSHFHRFGNEGGITGVVLLAESHLSVHTWPESSFAAADIFMCGAADAQCALAFLQQALSPQRLKIQTTVRGD
jgi:S-adenosylmethionine decarboxylase